tara:strand:- start:408 stop:2387 length:1980 start_codon:yes stop_codon:yes gene_type:complete
MTILRYTASLDNTITNLFFDPNESSLRATGSNTGGADILEVFSIYGRRGSAIKSTELSRILIQFPVDRIIEDRSKGKIPGAGKVNFYLKLFNSRHLYTTPSSYDLDISAVAASWEEGRGLDITTYQDLTFGGVGSNWVSRDGQNQNHITKLVFSSDTITAYGAGSDGAEVPSGVNYIKLFNDQTRYNFWFDDGSGDENPNAAGFNNKVDISAIDSPTKQKILAALKTVVEASGSSVFTSNIDPSNDAILYITSSHAAALPSSPAIVGTLAGIALSEQQPGRTSTPWTSVGGDYHNSPTFTQHFDKGIEDLFVNVTSLVEQWIAGSKQNYGFGIKLSDKFEAYNPATATDSNAPTNEDGERRSYFTKMFFGRSTEFFYKQPVLEAQFNSKISDDRGKFYISSSLLPSSLSSNKLYFYNYYRGRLYDIKGDASATPPTVKLYSGTSAGPVSKGASNDGIKFIKPAEGSPAASTTAANSVRISKGIYEATVCVTGALPASEPFLYDVWSVGSTEVLTGSAISPITYRPSQVATDVKYVTSMPNLEKEYNQSQTVRLRLYARQKGWSPNIYNKVVSKPENYIIASASYRVLRVIDDFEVIPYDFKSTNTQCSHLSYDVSGNYFDFSMNILEPGYQYAFKFSFYDGYTDSYVEQAKEFKFRVIE